MCNNFLSISGEVKGLTKIQDCRGTPTVRERLNGKAEFSKMLVLEEFATQGNITAKLSLPQNPTVRSLMRVKKSLLPSIQSVKN